MKDFSAVSAKTTAIPPECAAARRRWRAGSARNLYLGLATFAVLALCISHTIIARADTDQAAAFGYLSLTVIWLGCAAAFWTRARSAQGTLYIRWSFTSAAAVCAAIGYFISVAQNILNTFATRQFQTACFNSSEALYMLAAVLFFAGVSRFIVFIDILQALLFSILRFNLAYSPATRSHFSVHHLLIAQLMALFLFAVALIACLGATSRTELNFLRTLSCFLGLRLVAFFLANQVSYTWLHYENCSVWDVPGETLLAVFALYLLYTSRSVSRQPSQSAPLRAPSVLVRSLMPSLLTLVNLALALIVMRISVPLATAAISLSLVAYMARTVLLQAQAAHEKARLEIRNLHLEGLATRDPLTGIGNPRSLATAYGTLQAAENCGCLSMLLMDIDNFKQANDRYGHQHGDQILVALAKKLESFEARVAGSHSARLGGDEFALLLVDVTPQKAMLLAEELRDIFRGSVFESENRKTSLSIGIASLRSARDLPLETLIRHADEALYRAKSMGRNRVEVQPVWENENAAATTLRMKLQHAAR